MIPVREIKEKAREYGVPVSSIERDYAQNWLLKNLAHINMALKGGTGIRKVYIENYRFSDDLDFTLLEDISAEGIKNEIKAAVQRSREESGIFFFEDLLLMENENGYELNVYFQITLKGKNRMRIKIDITRLDKEKMLISPVERKIIHPYSDDLDATIKVYSLEEIVVEKIRSLFERTRPRDVYDVWFLWDKISVEEVLKILPEKFKIKNVEMDIKDFKERRESFKKAWNSSLRNQLRDLPEFDEVFSKVFEEVEKMCLETIKKMER